MLAYVWLQMQKNYIVKLYLLCREDEARQGEELFVNYGFSLNVALPWFRNAL